MNKKIITTITCVMVMFSLCFFVSAHPGRTDADGGHWDRSSGTYHYHNGEYAGRSQTYSPSVPNDNRNLYDEKVKEYRQKTRNFESVAELQKEAQKEVGVKKTPKVWLPEKNTSQEKNYLLSSLDTVLIYVLLSAFALFLFYIIVIKKIAFAIKQRLPRHKIYLYGNSIVDFYHNEAEIAKLHHQIKSSANFSAPSGIVIGSDNLPKEQGSAGWGERYTFYMTRSGRKLHKTRDCCGAYIPVHIYTYAKYYKSNTRKLLCSICCKNYSLPSFVWFDEYQKRTKAKKELKECQDKKDEILEKVKAFHQTCNSPAVTNSIFFTKENRLKLNLLNNDYETILNEQETHIEPCEENLEFIYPSKEVAPQKKDFKHTGRFYQHRRTC